MTDPTHIFVAQPSTPSYNVTLTVTDTSGSVGLSDPVAVSDVAPQVNGGTSATIHAGDPVFFQGTATAVGGSGLLALQAINPASGAHPTRNS